MFYRVLFEQFLNVDYEASDTKELPLQPFDICAGLVLWQKDYNV